MSISTYYKRLLSFFLSLVIILSSFSLVFAVEGEDTSDLVITSEEASTIEEEIPNEENEPSEEPEESTDEAPVVDSFEKLKAAIAANQTIIVLEGVIEFTEAINLPQVAYEIRGGTIKSGSFTGLGLVSFTSTTFSSGLTISSRAMVTIDGNSTSINAKDSANVVVNGDVVTGGNGVIIGGSASVTINGNIDAKGVGIIANGGSIKVNGKVKSGSDGIQFTKLSSIKKVGAISAGSGIMLKDLTGDGGSFVAYETGRTITASTSGELHVIYNGGDYTLRALDPNSPISFSLNSKHPSIMDNVIGYEPYKTFTLNAENCTASLTYTDSYRKGASAKIIKVDTKSSTELFSDKYDGSFSIEDALNTTIVFALTTVRYTVNTVVGADGKLSYNKKDSYLEGEVIEFVAVPNESFEVNTLLINDEYVFMQNRKYSYTVLEDATVTITFKYALKKYTVTFRQTVGGTVSRTGSVLVTEGDSLTFVMKPDDGYYLSMIEINKELMTDKSETYTIKNITEDLIVFITFKQLKTYSIVLKHTAGGTVVADDAAVQYGGSTKIRITPDEGYVVDKVIADFGTLSTTSDPNIYRLKNITVDTIVTVSFKKSDGYTPPPVIEMLKVSDVSWDYHPIRLELFDYTIISEEVIEKLKNDYPDIPFTIVGESFNWNFSGGEVASFPEGDLDFGITVGDSDYEDNHIGFSGGQFYISVSIPEGAPTVGELKIFVGRAYLGLPFAAYSFDGSTYTKISDNLCDAYFEITIPLGHEEIFMLCGGKPTNVVTITVVGNGSADPSATKYIRDGESLKIIFTPDDSSYIAKVTVNGVETTIKGQVLQLDNITEDLAVECIFLPHESTEISRYELPIIENRANVIFYVFAITFLGCLIVYIVMRRNGAIKYTNEL